MVCVIVAADDLLADIARLAVGYSLDETEHPPDGWLGIRPIRESEVIAMMARASGNGSACNDELGQCDGWWSRAHQVPR